MEKPLGEYLVKESICTREQIAEALRHQVLLKNRKEYRLLGIILLETGLLSEEQLIHALDFQARDNNRTPLYGNFQDEQEQLELLRRTPIFSSLTDGHQNLPAELAKFAQTKTFSSTTLIFQRGDPGDAFYMILSGSVKVFRHNEEGARVTLAYLGPGECFGEMALLTGEPRSASVEAIGETRLLVLEKADFDKLLGGDSKITHFLLRILSQRLQHADTQVEEESSREVALRHLLSTREDRAPTELIGNSRPIKELRNNVEKLAQEDTSVLIQREIGTEKRVVAQLIHSKSARKDDTLLIMECGNVPQILPGEDDGNTQSSPLVLELSQATALFGHEPGYLSFAKNRRLGYLEAAKGGTLVINDIEKLLPSLQAKLTESIQMGRFVRMGGTKPLGLDIRIIATTSIDLAAEKDEGRFNPELYAILSERNISIPPLRLRKRDIATIVERLIQKQSQSMGKQIQGITPDALNLILQYDWPHNLEELGGVIRRAVAICAGHLLTPEQIFIGLVPFEGAGRFNLLKIPGIRKVIESDLFPKTIQMGTVCLFSLILVGAFSQWQYLDFNFSLVMTWSIWWPLLILSFPFLARFWCGICPLSTASCWLKEGMGGFNLKVPEYLKKYGPPLSIVGFIGIIWA